MESRKNMDCMCMAVSCRSPLFNPGGGMYFPIHSCTGLFCFQLFPDCLLQCKTKCLKTKYKISAQARPIVCDWIPHRFAPCVLDSEGNGWGKYWSLEEHYFPGLSNCPVLENKNVTFFVSANTPQARTIPPTHF